MTVPYTFAAATSAIPLSSLDSNFATPITLGNTAILLGNTVTTLNNMTLANVTVSSGTVSITNVTVTTANVTTLNVASSVVSTSETLTYGTANGVLYLNGSKVATSGSALGFDGTTLTSGTYIKTGGGAASNGARLMVNTVNGTAAGLQLLQDSQESWIMEVPASSTALRWTASGVEYMRLNYTGLGIGTSSPGAKLDVSGGAKIDVGTYATGYALTLGAISETSRTYQIGMVAGGNLAIYDTSAAAQRVVLDTSGNLGLGVTPSAWSATAKAFQFGTFGALYQNASGYPELAFNTFQNTSNIYTYRNTDVATRYSQNNGTHQWYTAPSGTAGTAISFTQALTLDANGKLLVGLTSSRSTNAVVQANAPINLQGYTVATLPAGTVGDTAYVTDATAPTFLGTLTGGGTVKCPVFYNGTAWVAY